MKQTNTIIIKQFDIFGVPYSRTVQFASKASSPVVSLVAQQSPVNDDGGPADHGRLVTQQKQHSLSHVLHFWN